MTRAVFFDALGTLVELEPPWIHLGPGIGMDPDDERLVSAVRAEMSYYREHAHEGRDAGSLADLRRRCAELLSRELDRDVGIEEMMAAIRFRSFPDARPALEDLRARDLRLVVVSNWDAALPSVLDHVGLGELLDDVVTSASAGASKPDPAIFHRALEVAGCDPGDALHVGDTPEEDVEGARRAGIRALLLDREREGDIASLEEVAERL